MRAGIERQGGGDIQEAGRGLKPLVDCPSVVGGGVEQCGESGPQKGETWCRKVAQGIEVGVVN